MDDVTSPAPPAELTVSAAPTKDGNVAITIDGARFVMARAEARRLAEIILWASGDGFHRARDMRKAGAA